MQITKIRHFIKGRKKLRLKIQLEVAVIYDTSNVK